MKTEIQVFFNTSAPEFGQIRVIEINSEPYFVANDICAALGYEKARNAVAQHVDKGDALKQGLLSNGGVQQTTLINESGMYALIFGSKLEGAKKFTRWVTKEVLPSIRKTGAYAMKQAPIETQNAPVLEWYRNRPCIPAGWMISQGIMGKDNYDSMVYRGRIERLRRSCNATPALVAYDTLPERYKGRIEKRFGKIGLPAIPMGNEQMIALLTDICAVEDRDLRMSIVNKLMY